MNVFIVKKTLEINTESSILMIFSAVYYVALLFNHTFKIHGQFSMVKLIIILSGSTDSNTVFRKLRYFTYLTLRQLPDSVSTPWDLTNVLSRFKRFHFSAFCKHFNSLKKFSNVYYIYAANGHPLMARQSVTSFICTIKPNRVFSIACAMLKCSTR